MKRVIFLFASLLSSPFFLRAEDSLAKKVQALSLEDSEIKRVLYFLAILLVQSALIGLTSFVYRKAKLKIASLKETRLKSISFHGYDLLDTDKQVKLLIFLANMIRWLLIVLQLLFSVPILFSIFPETKNFATQLFSYVWKPVKFIGKGFVNYLPNLFTIIVIVLVIRYVVRILKYMTDQVAEGKLKISGFYPDWASPTYHIVRFLLYAFMVAMIYPYLPGPIRVCSRGCRSLSA